MLPCWGGLSAMTRKDAGEPALEDWDDGWSEFVQNPPPDNEDALMAKSQSIF
jgi:hypothetical protein